MDQGFRRRGMSMAGFDPALLGLPEISGSLFQADWPAPPAVRTVLTTRRGGVSQGPYAGLNLGAHVGDDAAAVARNRAWLAQQIGVPVAYLKQTHSADVVAATDALRACQAGEPLAADASIDGSGTVACAVMTADCLPVLLCDRKGTVVAAAHAGWRGLAAGILAHTVAAMRVPADEIMAYLGPAIGPDAFEVGQDVHDAFCRPQPQAECAFRAIGHGKYLADMNVLARQALAAAGVSDVYGGGYCTLLARDTFFSYRRDGQTGRMLSAIWLEGLDVEKT